MGITAYRRVGDQLLPWNAITAVAFGKAAGRLRDVGRASRRWRVGVVLRRSAILAGVLVAASTAGSIAQPTADAPVSIDARLSADTGKPLIEVGGIGEQDPSVDRYTITGYLRSVPCSGTTYRFVIVETLGAARATYAATLVLGKPRGSRIRCGVRLPRDLGRRAGGVDIRIYRKGARLSDSSVIVKGGRRNATRIEGSLTTNALVCGDAWLRVRLSSRSRPVVLRYDISFKSVSVNGVSVSGPPCSLNP